MSRGLGSMQRLLLRHMAASEVQWAEEAAQAQARYEPPLGWSISSLFCGLAQDTLYERAVEPQRRLHQRQREEWLDLESRVLAGDEDAKALYSLKLYAASLTGSAVPGRAEEFTPTPPTAYWDRFNASRVMRGLVSRQFVCRRAFCRRMEKWALTREGFAEARRLGLVAPSEIVDLDHLQERWCETSRLPFHSTIPWYLYDAAPQATP